MKIDSQLDNETILRNQGRPVHLSLTLEANAAGSSRPRPMAFCVVLDRSGSMHGTPLQQAKEACRTMVRHLHAEDFLSIVLFDSTAEVLLPLQKVSDRKAIYKLISSTGCLGSINLMGGWMLGLHELKSGSSFRKMKSHSSWSSGCPAPPLSRRSVAKENQLVWSVDAAATTPSSDASSSKTNKPRKSSSRGK